MKGFRTWIINHKKISLLIGVIVVGVGTYAGVKTFGASSAKTTYATAAAAKANIISSVTGSGQVSASNEFELKTKASGKLLVLNATTGQEVKKGALIAEVDPGTAGLQLQTAKLAYQEKFTIDDSALLQDQNAVNAASSSVASSYSNGLSSAASVLAALNTNLNDLQSLYSGNGYLSSSNISDLTDSAKTYRDKGNDTYFDAQNALTAELLKFQSVSAKSSRQDIRNAIADVYTVSKIVADAAKNAQAAADYIRAGGNNDSKDQTARATISNIVNSANSQQQSAGSLLDSIDSAERSYSEKQLALSKLSQGPTALEASTAELSLKQQQESYLNYFTYAPFDGVLASLDVKKGNDVSAGATIGTFITKDKVADISLNEVDATKVKVGQKATLTFDAVDGLSITGEVVQVDLVGTVSQGVVSYNVKIGFDTDDDRVKSGMSVSAAIITDSKQDVLSVPSSAIKSDGDTSYVEILEDGATSPKQQIVEVGLSDDTSTEILSGLNEGQKVVTKTTVVGATTAKTTTNSATSLFGENAVRGTGGRNFAR